MLILAWPTWGNPLEYTASDWAGLTFVFVALAALVAAWQSWEARRQREGQTRPFVVVDFNSWSTIIDLTIVNIGATQARDVQVTFDPPLTTTHDESTYRGSLMDLSMFKDGMPTLSPRKEMKIFFDQFPARLEAGLPLRYDVTLSYKGTGRKRYTDKTVIDLGMYVGTGGVTRYDIHDVHARLKEISKYLKAMSKL